MFNLKYLLSGPVGLYTYIWLEVILIKETRKAILIEFDKRRIWLPKAWVVEIKNKRSYIEEERVVSIKISLYHWSKKAG